MEPILEPQWYAGCADILTTGSAKRSTRYEVCIAKRTIAGENKSPWTRSAPANRAGSAFAVTDATAAKLLQEAAKARAVRAARAIAAVVTTVHVEITATATSKRTPIMV
ncbi:hypothetical protein BIW11_12713 [Tropilaelaps mercedesae]|uniref:Uncharacterized protein n=1 Tax=Tropilaelaps mercedesae TaxID=418985 RepID=A0A1V9X5N8_9ACAR|nr:hypothetical protein BIW11_12713 [Tropilaelaps mercedesae]